MNIFTWFGVPRAIISDEGTHFDNKLTAKLAGEQRLLELNELEEFTTHSYENARIYKEKTKKWHDQKLMPRYFHIGKQVFLTIPVLNFFPGKLKSQWSGPFEVHYVYPRGAVDINNIDDGTIFKVNGQHLKICNGASPVCDKSALYLQNA
ncbi:uncharacterized protein LOC120138907 [Hibiscus syriacus]|uniref:uncharacterized protein LOC120138907 n=1 Tax=Hibiscus syriacus TaxID=106335 RepID=UPI001920C2B8|nr:uncharacterized protein LOC120138907 [Hibiscus syriacus]